MRSLKNGKIGRYTILEELGRSASGKTFRAHDPINERDVILRALEANLPQQQKQAFLQRFLEEARAVAKLRHPNIMAMLDVGESNDTCFVVTEFIAGRSLEAMLRDVAVPAEQIIDLATQAAEGLAYAHNIGITHRGLKPSKLLLGDDGCLRITDFGIAGVAETSISRIGQILNAPHYIAPEQITGKNTDARTDLHALGAVLYEMATGQPAFGRNGNGKLHEMIKEIVTTAPERPSVLKPDLPAGLDAIICRLLEKTPEDRYQNAGQLITELRQLSLPETNTSPATTTAAPKLRATHRRRRGISAKTATEMAAQEDALNNFENGLVADIEIFKERSDDILASARENETQAVNLALQAARKAPKTEPDFPIICAGRLASPDETLPKPGPGTLLGDLTTAALHLKEVNRKTAERATALSKDEAHATSIRMRQLFEYLSDLTAQLNVIKPANPHIYQLPLVGEISGLKWDSGRVDCRPHGHEVSSQIELVSLSYTLKGPQSFELLRDPASAGVLRKTLIAACAIFSEAQIYGTGGITSEIMFTIPGTVKVSADFCCNYQTGAVQLLLTNANRFGRAHFHIAPETLTLNFFEEFGLRLLGRPNHLADYLSPLNTLNQQREG